MSASLMASGSYPMRPLSYAMVVLSLVLAAGTVGIHEMVASAPSLMSRADNSSARVAIQSARGTALAACGAMNAGHAADVCGARARGEDRFERADLEARYRGTAAAAFDARRARSQANFEIANARCGNLAGVDRTACLLQARSTRDAEGSRLNRES